MLCSSGVKKNSKIVKNYTFLLVSATNEDKWMATIKIDFFPKSPHPKAAMPYTRKKHKI